MYLVISNHRQNEDLAWWQQTTKQSAMEEVI